MKRLFSILLFVFATSLAWGSHKHVSFEVLNKDDGLNNNTIYAIMKDKDGCMWFATDLGLSKYDGLFFHNFPMPAITSAVVFLYEFDDGIILAQTVTGRVFAFDYIKERQINIYCDNKSITDYPIRIAPASSNSFYATGPTGLSIVDLNVDRDNNVVLFDAKNVASINDDLLFAASDDKGRLFSYVQGTTKILCYDPTTKGVRYIDFGDSYKLDVNGTVDRMKAFDDNLWIGLKYDGVLCYDFKSDKVVKIIGDNYPHPLFERNYNYVMDIDKYDDTTFFAATQKGAFRMRFNGSKVDQNIVLNISPTSELTFRNFIEAQSMCVFVDKERNLVWVGTFGGGVIKHDLDNEFYDHIDMDGVEVNSMFEDRYGYLWLATCGRGILRSDSHKLDRHTKFTAWDSPYNDSHNRYTSYRDRNSGLVLFGDSNGDLIELDDLTGDVEQYRLYYPKNLSLRMVINGVFIDSKMRRWVVTTQGLFYRKPSDVNYKYADINIPTYGNGLSSIIEDGEGRIWIGTPNGVARLGVSASGAIIIDKQGYEQAMGFDYSQVFSMFVNAKGQIVVGYKDRIHRINSSRDSMEYVCSLVDNLPDGHITCMVDDKLGNTWFGTNAGVINIRSSGKNVFNYSTQGAIRSTYRLSDGRLVWSGSNGLMFFSPAIAYNDLVPNKLILSALYMGRVRILAGVEYENGAYIDQTLSQTTRIELPYSKSSMSIFMADRQYTITPKRYSYMLEPLMADWESTTAMNGINFQWLPDGKYTLRVKPQFHDDTFGQQSVFELIITPPWYDSWWMWCIYILYGAGLLFGIYFFIGKHFARLKEGYLGKILEVSNKRVIDLQDSGVDDMEEVAGELKTILIVASDGSFTKKMERTLGESYTLLKAGNVTEGLFAALDKVPSVIVCETKVQGESGFELCRKVKDNLQTCHIPFLMFGDAAQSDTKVQTLSTHYCCDAYLSKSSGVDVILAMFTRLLHNRDQIRQSVANYIGHHSPDDVIVVAGDDNQPDCRDNEFVKEIVEVIENNIGSSDFNVKRLAELVNMSQSTLYRRVMQSTQTSIVELVRDVKLNKAAALLRDNRKLSVQQVAEMVGYNDMATFRKYFSAMFGVTPSRYAK